jgi:hypothetical protein
VCLSLSLSLSGVLTLPFWKKGKEISLTSLSHSHTHRPPDFSLLRSSARNREKSREKSTDRERGEGERGGVGGEGCLDAYTYTFYILSPSLSQANAREAAVEEERTNLRYASV